MEVSLIVELLKDKDTYKDLRQLKLDIYQEDQYSSLFQPIIRKAMQDCYQAIQKVLSNKNSEPMRQLLAIRLLKDCYDFQNTDFVKITLPLIPSLKQIALFKKHIKKEDRGRFYFSENPDKDQAQCGLTIHRLVLECISAWSIYYPQYYYQTYDYLIKQDVLMPTGYQYFKEEQLTQKMSNKIYPFPSELLQSEDHHIQQKKANDLKRILMKIKAACMQQEEPENLQEFINELKNHEHLIKADLQHYLDSKNEEEFEKLYDDNDKRENILKSYMDLQNHVISWEQFKKFMKGPEILPISHNQFNSNSKVFSSQSQLIQQHENKNDNSEIEYLKRKNENNEQKNLELQKKIKDLQQLLDEKDQKLSEQQQENILIHQQLDSIKNYHQEKNSLAENYKNLLKLQQDQNSQLCTQMQEQQDNIESLQLKLQAKQNECEQLSQQIQIIIQSNDNEKLSMSRLQEREDQLEKEYQQRLSQKLQEVQQKHSKELYQELTRQKEQLQSQQNAQIQQVKEDHNKKLKSELENQRVALENHYTQKIKQIETQFEGKLDAQKQLHQILESKQQSQVVQPINFLPLNLSLDDQLQSISSEVLQELHQLRQRCQILVKEKNDQKMQIQKLQDEVYLQPICLEKEVSEKQGEQSNFAEIVAKQLEINQLNEDKDQLKEEINKLYDENTILSKENQDLRDQLHECEMQMLKSQPLKDNSNIVDNKQFSFYQLEQKMQDFHTIDPVGSYVDHSDMIFPYTNPKDYYLNKIKQNPKGQNYDLMNKYDFDFSKVKLLGFGQEQIIKDQSLDFAVIPQNNQLVVVFQNNKVKGIKCNYESKIGRENNLLKIEIKTSRNELNIEYVKLGYENGQIKLPLTIFQQAKFIKMSIGEFKQKWRKGNIIRSSQQKLNIKWEYVLKLWPYNIILNDSKISEYQYGIDELKIGGGLIIRNNLYLMKLELIPENYYILQVTGQQENICYEILEQFSQIIKS